LISVSFRSKRILSSRATISHSSCMRVHLEQNRDWTQSPPAVPSMLYVARIRECCSITINPIDTISISENRQLR
jgi:hypothetical protein